MSDFLKRVLGDGYVPNNHWLSPLRIADGHAIYRREGEEYFRFRFTDTTARFSRFLHDNGVELDKDLPNPRTFHIAVYPTHDTVISTFTLDHDHYERVCIPTLSHILLPPKLEEQWAVNLYRTNYVLDLRIHGR